MLLDPHQYPRISFGVIVLDGEPFTRFCLRQIYPHAHEIIVVEGGSEKAAAIAPEGHSTDGTIQALQRFKQEEDPEDKVRLVSRAGFWSEKDEQSQAYACRATGDYLWQLDIDEFYRHVDIDRVRQTLASDLTIDTVSFRQYAFWGSPLILATGFALITDLRDEYHRLFRWKQGYAYKTHRPPTVADECGVDLRQKRWVRATESESWGVRLFHYSLLFPAQVRNKCEYYARPTQFTRRAYVPGIIEWASNSYFALKHPFRVHNVFSSLSWLERYSGSHPEEAMAMWASAKAGSLGYELRNNADADRLLSKPTYRLACKFLSGLAHLCLLPPFGLLRRLFLKCKRLVRSPG